MKLSIDISAALHRQLKDRAASEGTTMKTLIQRGIDSVLSSHRGPRRKHLKLPVLRSANPGVLEIDNERIYDLIGFP